MGGKRRYGKRKYKSAGMENVGLSSKYGNGKSDLNPEVTGK